MLKPRIGVYGVYEKSEEGWENAQATLASACEHLRRTANEPALAPELVSDEASAARVAEFFGRQDIDALLCVVINWSFDNLTLSILRRVPRCLAILAIPGITAGSIVGAQQLGCVMTELGLKHMTAYGDPTAPATYAGITAYARAAAARGIFERGRIGNIGRRTPGMTPVAFDEMEIMNLFGPQIVSYDWEEIERAARSVESAAVDEELKRMRKIFNKIESGNEGVDESLRLYLALRGLVRRDGLLSLSLGCYPQHAGRVCLAIGLLCDDGIQCACEADMNSCLSMSLLQMFTGQAAHFGEVLAVDEREDTVVTSHCGCAAPSLAARPADVHMTPVRLHNTGACIRFPAKAGPATFVNLVGRRGTYRMCVIEGQAVESGMVFQGNPVKFRLPMPVRKFLGMIDEDGFGHHWMLGYGHVAAELKHFCRIAGVRGLFA